MGTSGHVGGFVPSQRYVTRTPSRQAISTPLHIAFLDIGVDAWVNNPVGFGPRKELVAEGVGTPAERPSTFAVITSSLIAWAGSGGGLVRLISAVE